ncbi:MAG: hypothetical protein EBT03_12765 [Betaproteobacteria bacterium]|nr:hypothetical protein [Betaproteobacteria bacterium]
MASQLVKFSAPGRAQLQKISAALPPMPKEPQKTQVAALQAVIIYGASWCKKCKEAKAYYESKGQPLSYFDIEEQPEKEAEMVAKLKSIGRGFTSLPVLDIGGNISVGFTAPSAASEQAVAKDESTQTSSESAQLVSDTVEARPTGRRFDFRIGAASGLAGLALGWFAAGIFVTRKKS